MKSPSAHRSALAAGWFLVGACASNDVPEHEPTLGTAGTGDAASVDDGADGGVDDTATGGAPEEQCWPDHLPNVPALFQCVGAGAGVLEWEQYAGAWSAASQPVTIEFPSGDQGAPNVQACCEADAEPLDVNVGCLGDCARAACNLAVEKLRAKREGGPPAGCAGDCKLRFEETLDTWASFIEASYDQCLESVRDARPFHLPDPPSVHDTWPWGAGRGATLTIECNVDSLADPYDTGQRCDTSLNPPIDAAWQEWVCPAIDGEVLVSASHGVESARLRGSVAFRRGLCESEPCWVEIEALALETIPSPERGDILAGPVHASLAYPAFGLTTGPEATLGVGMLGLHVTLGPGVTMANSEPVRIDLRDGFTIREAWFAWKAEGVTLSLASASCSCTSCS